MLDSWAPCRRVGPVARADFKISVRSQNVKTCFSTVDAQAVALWQLFLESGTHYRGPPGSQADPEWFIFR